MKGTWRFAAALALLFLGAALLIEAVGDAGGRLALTGRGVRLATETVSPDDPFPRTVTDDMGRVVTIPAPPTRIVSNSITVDGLLFALVDPERVAAVSPLSMDPRYSDVADSAQRQGLPSSESPEVALSLGPDIVFAGLHARAEWLALMRHASAPIYRVGDTVLKVSDLLSLVRRIGYLTGADDSADRVVQSWQARLERARQRVPESGAPPPRVLGYNRALSYSYGTETLFHDAVTLIGATNVGAEQGLTSYERISTEEIADWNPEWIVTGADPGQRDGLERQLLDDPGIAVTHAARSGQILILPQHVFLTVSHNIVALIESIADALYPEEM